MMAEPVLNKKQLREWILGVIVEDIPLTDTAALIKASGHATYVVAEMEKMNMLNPQVK